MPDRSDDDRQRRTDLRSPFSCIRKTKVIIEYGEPIETKNLDRTQQKALTSQVVARISETYEKNMKLLSGENK